MPIPQTRQELVELLHTSFQKLWKELQDAGEISTLPCVDEWSVKDLLAVRMWWTESVLSWIEEGERGGSPVTPAEGYRWKETPRLNADIVAANQETPYAEILSRLDKGYNDVMGLIERLDDRQLLDKGVFTWAGNYPISRWLSINTARQYTTARTYVRKAIKTRAATSPSEQPSLRE